MAGIKFSLDVKGLKNIETRMAAASKRASHDLATQVARDTEQYVPLPECTIEHRSKETRSYIQDPMHGIYITEKLW